MEHSKKIRTPTTTGGALLTLVLLAWWLAGIVLAKGVWSTGFAIFMPPWGMYLVVEKIMIAQGWV